jgi:hypothetical protein
MPSFAFKSRRGSADGKGITQPGRPDGGDAHGPETMRHLVVLGTLSAFACAQDMQATPAPERVVAGSLRLDVVSQAFFRGIMKKNQGLIVQPAIDLGYTVYEGEGDETLRVMNLNFGLFNSLEDEHPGADGPWSEGTFHTGLSAGLGERWQAGMTYSAYYSPNSAAAGTVEELAFAVGWDDRGMLLDSIDSGLQPSVVIAIETDGQQDGGNHVGIYAQFAIEPSFPLGQLGSLDVTLATPVTLGTSLSDYYEDVTGGDDEFFGFLDFGVVATSPLPFLPSRAGAWTGHVGLHWLLLGDNNEERNESGDTSELIVSFGMATTF